MILKMEIIKEIGLINMELLGTVLPTILGNSCLIVHELGKA